MKKLITEQAFHTSAENELASFQVDEWKIMQVEMSAVRETKKARGMHGVSARV